MEKDYISLIQDRKSARGFMDKPVTGETLKIIKDYFDKECRRLIPDANVEAVLTDGSIQENLRLVKAAGYEENLIGAPAYLIILVDDCEYAIENASYMAEDIVLKNMELGLGSCFITFADGERIKFAANIESDKKVACMIAFGYEARLKKKMRFNFLTMANIGIKEKRHYFDPKKKIEDITYVDTYGNSEGVDERIGFYDDIMWQALYAATLSPSYLNRQPYAFVLTHEGVVLVSVDDAFTDEVSMKQDLGIVMLHFEAAASQLCNFEVKWNMEVKDMTLPEGCKAVATIKF